MAQINEIILPTSFPPYYASFFAVISLKLIIKERRKRAARGVKRKIFFYVYFWGPNREAKGEEIMFRPSKRLFSTFRTAIGKWQR